MKQNFEQIMREKVSIHEVPYEAGAWEKFQQNIPAATPFYKKSWFVASGLMLLIASGVILFNTKSKETQNTKNETLGLLTEQEATKNIKLESAQPETSTTTQVSAEETENSTQTKANTGQETPHGNDIGNPSVNPEKDGENKLTQQPNTPNSQPTQSLTNDDNSSTPNGDENPSSNTSTTPLNSNPKANASFYLEKSVCKGSQIVLIPDDIHPSFNYLWIVNGKETLRGSSVSIKASDIGINSIVLSVRDKQEKVLATKSLTINVIDLPDATIEVENDEFSVKNNYKFELLSAPNSTIEWDLGDGTTSNKAVVNHTYKTGGIVKATCTVTNEQGCSSVYTKKIDVKGLYNIRTDYGFSPNGDNINDEFIPIALTTLNVPFTMNIYARGGKLIYTTNSLQQPWNGTMLDGTKSPFGSYVWVVTLTNEYGNQEVYKGTVTNVTN